MFEKVRIWRWRHIDVVEHFSCVFQNGAVILPAIIVSGLNYHGSLLGYISFASLLFVCLLFLFLLDSTFSGVKFVRWVALILDLSWAAV